MVSMALFITDTVGVVGIIVGVINIVVTARVRSTTGGYIVTLCVCPHGGGVGSTYLPGRGGYLPSQVWMGGVPTFPGLDGGGGVPTFQALGGVPSFLGLDGEGVPSRQGVPTFWAGGYLPAEGTHLVGTPSPG